MQIGPYRFPNPVALAPMAGVTDRPFRQLCRRLGAGLAASEMITADTRLWGSRKTRQRLDHRGEPAPIIVQVAGGDPDMVADAARHAVDRGAQIVDINMGCPAKKVCNTLAGSALLSHPGRVRAILRAVVDAVDVPVTLKIRTGPNPLERNGVEIAGIAEEEGIAALAVHGRTRADRFRGEAEYRTIGEICRAVSIPVFANGDIDTPQKAREVLEHTGAAGIMIGRGAQGRPWLCGQIAAYLEDGTVVTEPSLDARFDVIHRHLAELHEFYGDFMGVRIARKHMGWYLQHLPVSGDWRKQFNALGSPTEQRRLTDQIYHSLNDKELAA